LRHFLLTIPLGSLLTTVIVMYLLPMIRQGNVQWHELYLIVVAVNIAVTVLAYVLMPGLPALRRPASR
ncbi:MAG: hypothetical protein N3H32_04275, partial [Nitrososphaeria archaeon]|nr:hypothetical protein [Nitrososphaeria archaeon]